MLSFQFCVWIFLPVKSEWQKKKIKNRVFWRKSRDFSALNKCFSGLPFFPQILHVFHSSAAVPKKIYLWFCGEKKKRIYRDSRISLCRKKSQIPTSPEKHCRCTKAGNEEGTAAQDTVAKGNDPIISRI